MKTKISDEDENETASFEHVQVVELLPFSRSRRSPKIRTEDSHSSSSRTATMFTWKRLLLISVGLAVLTVLTMAAVILTRAFIVGPPEPLPHLKFPLEDIEMVEEQGMLERAQKLATALGIPTVSYDRRPRGETNNDENFKTFHEHLSTAFPNIHNTSYITREIINGKSLLYSVTGSAPGKLPYLLMAHMDVVPANPNDWIFDPFGGKIINDSIIYGRGALDDKTSVIGILEALEYLISREQRPKRSFFIAFGHDEEISGTQGAAYIAKTLRDRGVKALDFILDEGLPVTRGFMPGTDKNIALIGVTEKGYLSVELSVQGQPRHSSFPSRDSPIVILADAVSRLDKHQMPSAIGSGMERYFFEYLVPHVSFGYKILFSNLWLFSDLISNSMERSPETSALIRTTTAVTVFEAGNKTNVVPGNAHAVINHRVHPPQKVKDVLAWDRKVVGDNRVKMREISSREPQPISPFGPGDMPYQSLVASVRQAFPGTVVVPGVLIANTDTFWYLGFTRNVYRFLPLVLQDPADAAMYHGLNERITVTQYQGTVSFYHRFILNAEERLDLVPDIF